MELEKAIQLAKEESRKVIELGEEHEPMLFILTPDGISLARLVMLKGKDIFREATAAVLRQLHAHAYVFISEAWSVNLAKDSPLLPKLTEGEISVSELPLDDRTEILSIMAVENNKSHQCWFAKIKYTPEGKRYLDEWNMVEGSPEGRLILKEW